MYPSREVNFMRRNIWLTALVAAFVIPALGTSRGLAQGQSQDQSTSATASQQDPIADAARRAKEQKKDQTKTSKVFTNDDLPSNSTPSPAASSSATPADKSVESAPGKAATSDEKMWRAKFARLNHKLEQDQSELDILQRELSVLNSQYYGGDPMKGLQQGLSQQEINAKRDKIDAKKKDIADDQQAIADAESDLQKAGGDPGWER
jgi:hypothetical protein